MKDVVTIVFGDSIAYGIGDVKDSGWLNRIRIKLNKVYNNYYIFNLAIPGQNSGDILIRCDQEIKNRFNTSDDFKIVYALGIKDALLINDNPEHIKKFKKNIESIIKISKKYTDEIYFIGLLNVDLNIKKNYNLENIIIIDNNLEIICKKFKVSYIKVNNVLSNKDLFDGIHPNNNGHKKICDYLLEKIFMVNNL